MSVSKLMSRRVVTVDIDSDLYTIKGIFEQVKFHHLLVVEKKHLVGVISDRDLLQALHPMVDSVVASSKELACLNKKAHQIMSRGMLVLPEGADVQDAIRIFNRNSVSCIPIVNSEMHPVGILSWRDIMKVLEKRDK